MFMDIMLHLGTFAAIIVFFRKGLSSLVISFFHRPFDFQNPETSTVWKIALASLPTAVIGLFIKLKLSFVYESIDIVLLCLAVTATFLFLSDLIKSKEKGISSLSWKAVLFIGLIQGFAVLPGISRSGSTIVAGLLVGLARKEAGVFSFYIGIPAIIGAAIIELKDISFAVDSSLLLNAGVALFLSFIIALFCIRFLFYMLQFSRFRYFSIYLVVVIILSLLLRNIL